MFKHTAESAQTDLTYLETVKKMIKLLRGEVPCQFGQEVMDILDDSLMLSSLQTGKVAFKL